MSDRASQCTVKLLLMLELTTVAQMVESDLHPDSCLADCHHVLVYECSGTMAGTGCPASVSLPDGSCGYNGILPPQSKVTTVQRFEILLYDIIV